MKRLELAKIIHLPHLSEKATNLADQNRQHAFVVARSASKKEIKVAVESLFNVKVLAVRVMNVKGKHKLIVRQRKQGRRAHWKKAYVTLQEGFDIELSGVA